MRPSESREIAKAAAGDRRAQKRIVEQNLPRIYALALRMVMRTDIAEEIAQETFLRAWRAMPSWEPKAQLSTWLHRVALNLCYDHLRRKGEITLAQLPERIDETPGPADELARKQENHRLYVAIASLPARQRAAIALCSIGGMPQKEAADVLETSVDALESLLARAKRSLREKLTADQDSGVGI